MSATPREHRLTHGPVLPVLVSMALPNVLAMAAAAAVSIGETGYVGALGREPLAAMAVVFPFAMLMQTLSAGAMGGANASAISRALGAGDIAGAQTLAWHAAVVGLGAGCAFTVLLMLTGPTLFRLLGAHDAVLAESVRYSSALFVGAPAIWLSNTLVSMVRGSGDMRTPSLAILAAAMAQLAIGATLGLGLGPLPRWGMVGVAVGQVVAYGVSALALGNWLRSPLPGCASVARHRAAPLRASPSCASACWPRVAAAERAHGADPDGPDRAPRCRCVGRLRHRHAARVPADPDRLWRRRGDRADGRHRRGARRPARARRVAWIGSALAGALVGVIGVVVSIWPALWPSMFTSEPGVTAYAQQFMRYAGPGFAFYGFALSLYFASQGAGRVLGVVLGASVRLGVVVLGGWWLSAAQAPAWSYFALVCAAMVAYGLFNAGAVWLSRWKRSGALSPAPRLKTS